MDHSPRKDNSERIHALEDFLKRRTGSFNMDARFAYGYLVNFFPFGKLIGAHELSDGVLINAFGKVPTSIKAMPENGNIKLFALADEAIDSFDLKEVRVEFTEGGENDGQMVLRLFDQYGERIWGDVDTSDITK